MGVDLGVPEESDADATSLPGPVGIMTSPRRPPLVLGMGPTLDLLEESLRISEELDGRHTVQDPQVGPGRVSKQHLAETSQQLLRLAALCRAAGSEAETVYWQLKGYEDPRTTEGESNV